MQNSFNFMFNNQNGVNPVVNISGYHNQNLSAKSWARNSVVKLQYQRDADYFGGIQKTCSLSGLYQAEQNKDLY